MAQSTRAWTAPALAVAMQINLRQELARWYTCKPDMLGTVAATENPLRLVHTTRRSLNVRDRNHVSVATSRHTRHNCQHLDAGLGNPDACGHMF